MLSIIKTKDIFIVLLLLPILQQVGHLENKFVFQILVLSIDLAIIL